MGARPHHNHDLAARLVLQRVEDALGRRGEVGGGLRRVFLVHDLGLGADGGQRVLERGHAVLAEGVILGERGDADVLVLQGRRAGQRILGRVARGAEDVAVPLVAGDLVGHGGLDDQELLVLLGNRQHGERRGRRGGADGDVDLVVAIGLLEGGLGEVGLELVVLQDDLDLAAVDFHRALGRVVQAEHEAGLGLARIGLERAGLAVDQGDLERRLLGGGRHGQRQSGQDNKRTTEHQSVLLCWTLF